MPQKIRVDPKTGQWDAKDIARHMREASPQGRLEKYLKTYKGSFQTTLQCSCRSKSCRIMDEATPHYARRDGPMLIGAPRDFSLPQRIDHTYYGKECGTMFFGPVIEGERGYTPREKRKKVEEE